MSATSDRRDGSSMSSGLRASWPRLALAASATLLVVLVIGVYPQPFAKLGELARIARF